jgi:hypothetical protein
VQGDAIVSSALGAPSSDGTSEPLNGSKVESGQLAINAVSAGRGRPTGNDLDPHARLHLRVREIVLGPRG